MGFQDREYQRRLSFAQERNSLISLLAINLVIFVILMFIRAIYALQTQDSNQATINFDNNVVTWFSLPAAWNELAAKPWTIISHMFTHVGLWHIIGNMLWLWMFGYILHDLTGNRKIIPIYLYGGLAGGLAFILAYNFLPALLPDVSRQSALGASAGVMAIAAAVTTLSPGYKVFTMLNGGIPVWIITLIYLVIDLAQAPLSNSGGHIAHLAGALAGFLFIFFFRKGYDLGAWMNQFFDWVSNLFNPDKPKKGKSIKEELFYQSPTKPFKKTPNITEQRIDEILDKINQKGYDSLTDEEKDLLKRASKEK